MMRKTFILLLSFLCTFSFAQNKLSKRDSNFVRNAAGHTLFEMKMAELAQNKAITPEVKSIAMELHNYHSKVYTELKQLADAKHISIPAQIDEKGQKYYDKLAKKEGKEFDKAYTRCVVKTHKMGACYLKKESRKGKDLEITAWATTNYPVLEQLRDKVKSTCKAIKNKK